MSTRSNIAIELEDGTVKSIYCHFDGYVGYVGQTLFEHYQDRKKVEKLIELGSISSLYPEVDIPNGSKHSFEKPEDGITVAYHRDRGEEKHIEIDKSAKDFFKDINGMIEYGYLFTHAGEWLAKSAYGTFKGIIPLEDAIKKVS